MLVGVLMDGAHDGGASAASALANLLPSLPASAAVALLSNLSPPATRAALRKAGVPLCRVAAVAADCGAVLLSGPGLDIESTGWRHRVAFRWSRSAAAAALQSSSGGALRPAPAGGSELLEEDEIIAAAGAASSAAAAAPSPAPLPGGNNTAAAVEASCSAVSASNGVTSLAKGVARVSVDALAPPTPTKHRPGHLSCPSHSLPSPDAVSLSLSLPNHQLHVLAPSVSLPFPSPPRAPRLPSPLLRLRLVDSAKAVPSPAVLAKALRARGVRASLHYEAGGRELRALPLRASRVLALRHIAASLGVPLRRCVLLAVGEGDGDRGDASSGLPAIIIVAAPPPPPPPGGGAGHSPSPPPPAGPLQRAPSLQADEEAVRAAVVRCPRRLKDGDAAALRAAIAAEVARCEEDARLEAGGGKAASS